ncbi:MAG TPA: hypothetical protein VNU01_11575 [Egibacteraceae bacterium]|nr:hypothetical protein [Egibacteraceae bacterium]
MPAAATREEPRLPTPRGWPFADAFPRTSGTGRLHQGTVQWTDFLYDDRGARGVPVRSAITPLAPTRGTYEYLAAEAAGNGADIFRAAIGLDAEATYWRVDWNTLVDPAVPIAQFALDVDGSASTGAADWPAAAGVRSPGIERALLLSAKGAWLVDAATGARRALGAPAVDLAARSFVLRVPRATLPVAGRWTVRLAAGVADASGEAFAPVPPSHGARPGGTAVYNVAFRTHAQEPPLTGSPRSPLVANYWQEVAQATALADGDVTPFALELDWAALAAGATTAEESPAGWSTRWYVSSIEPGHGVVADTGGRQDLRPNYLGRVQPYAVYVPSSYRPDRPAPLTWLLHSAFQPHTAFAVVTPRFAEAACERRGSICATPLGRGHDGWYLDEAELDFWEVWNRLAAAYALDPDRTVLAGFSMGGYAAYRLGFAHPHLFSGGVAIGGTPTCGERVAPGVERPAGPGRCATDGDTTALVGNARWLPFHIAHGTADELLPFTGTAAHVAAFDRLRYRYRFDHYAGQTHVPWYQQDRWDDIAAAMPSGPRTRTVDRVTLRWRPHLARPEWGLGVTGAYWARDLRPRTVTAGGTARLDARALARPLPAMLPTRTFRLATPDSTTPALVTEVTWTAGATPAAEARLALDLRNVAHVRVALDEAGFGDGPVTVSTRSDGPATVTLTHGARTYTLTVAAGDQTHVVR